MANVSLGKKRYINTYRRIQQALILNRHALQEVHASLELADAFSAEERARKLLLGLGFSKAALDEPITKLSGGWQAKAGLAQALFMEPDILLLDEPTNALDVEGIIFLQVCACGRKCMIAR